MSDATADGSLDLNEHPAAPREAMRARMAEWQRAVRSAIAFAGE